MIIPVLATIVAIVAALVAIVIVRQRRGHKSARGAIVSYSRVDVYSVLIVLAAILCLIISFGLFSSGLEANSQNDSFSNISFNINYVFLFEGVLGILCSAFVLMTEAFLYGDFLFSALGSCFLLFQGLQIVELGLATSVGGGLQIVAIFGIPICVLSLLSLVLNEGFARAMQ
jgi:hypothetical protein